MATKPSKKTSTPKSRGKTTKSSAAAKNKVDYYPNRVPVLVALLAATVLVVLALLTAY